VFLQKVNSNWKDRVSFNLCVSKCYLLSVKIFIKFVYLIIYIKINLLAFLHVCTSVSPKIRPKITLLISTKLDMVEEI
jgi:hypothetical protein